MERIADALELLTAQHEEIDALLEQVATAANPTVRAPVLEQLVEKLSVHLAAEQELFYPAVQDVIGEPVVAELVTEHAEMKRVLADLVWLEVDDVRFAEQLVALRGLLEVHAVWQERHLFEEVAEAMTTTELVLLGDHLHAWIDRTVVFATAA